MCAWYLFFALMFSAVNFPFALPVGDLSGLLGRVGSKSVVSEEENI
jgi:hypothetical protein